MITAGRVGWVPAARAWVIVSPARPLSSTQTLLQDAGGPSKAESARGVADVAVPSPRRSAIDASYKKGTGGRMSFSGNVCTVFGATGFLGKFVVARLAKDGTQLVIPYRRDPYWVRHLKVSADLGQMLFFPFHLMDDDSLRKSVKYSNIVINMIGRDYETPNFSFWDVHTEGARRIARVCREMGVKRLIHFSGLNASHHPQPHLIPGGSEWLRSKAAGEDVVREEFPDAVIIRPSDVYGLADRFLSTYSYYWRMGLLTKHINMYRRGEETFKMPIDAHDIAPGVHRIVQDPTIKGQTFEFVGPECYRMSEIVDFIMRSIGWGMLDGKVYQRRNGYMGVTALKANIQEWYKCKIRRIQPKFTWEHFERIEATSDVLTGCPTLHELGIRELGLFPYAARPWLEENYTRIGHFEPELGELPEVPLPETSPPLYAADILKRQQEFKTTSKPFTGEDARVFGLS